MALNDDNLLVLGWQVNTSVFIVDSCGSGAVAGEAGGFITNLFQRGDIHTQETGGKRRA
jgi:hypothetical protein